jgi:hypothetical protein
MGCPTPFVLGRLLKPLSRLDVEEEGERKSALIRKSVEQHRYMDEVIAIAILGDVKMTPVARLRLHLMKRRFRRANDVERLAAFNEMLSLFNPDSFFSYARLAMELTGRLANTKSSEGGR